jgi:hypothetical protein
MTGFTMKEKQTLTREYAPRYRQADRKMKRGILDEYIRLTGYHRKYAMALLKGWGKTILMQVDGTPVKLKAGTTTRRKGGGRKPRYGPEVTASLRSIRAFFGYRCGKLRSPLMRNQMAFFQPWPPFHLTADIRDKLLTISPATIDRALQSDRKKLTLKGKSGTKPGKLLKKHISVRTHYPWNERNPGFFEVDTVHHCGERDSGEFCLTLTATDVASGWVELRPLLNKAQQWILQALPFPLVGIDSDNGSEFINHSLSSWCDSLQVAFTRTRPYKKNDTCFIEQKNLKCVRDSVGYSPFDTPTEHQALARVYRSLCPLLNYFLPTVKLIDKIRVGATVRKVYDQPRSPYQRLLASPDLSDEAKAELKRRYESYNPVLLQQEVHQAVSALMEQNRRKALMRQQSLTAAARE